MSSRMNFQIWSIMAFLNKKPVQIHSLQAWKRVQQANIYRSEIILKTKLLLTTISINICLMKNVYYKLLRKEYYNETWSYRLFAVANIFINSTSWNCWQTNSSIISNNLRSSTYQSLEYRLLNLPLGARYTWYEHDDKNSTFLLY